MATRLTGQRALVGSVGLKHGVVMFSGTGAPSNGTSGTGAGKAGPGSLYVDATNKKLYQNTNTKASPTWQSVGDIAAAEIALADGKVLIGGAGGAAAAQTLSGDLTTTNTGVTTLGAVVTGAKVPTTADANVIGAVPLLHRVDVADGATGDIDTVLTHKTRVLDVWLVKTGGAGHASEDTITVKNGATAITDAIAVGAADKAIKRAGTIDDASWEIAAAGTLRITRTKGAGGGNNVQCTVYVLGLRVA